MKTSYCGDCGKTLSKPSYKYCRKHQQVGDRNAMFKNAHLTSVCSICHKTFLYYKGSKSGRVCSIPCRSVRTKLLGTQRKENNPMWRGGVSSENVLLRNSEIARSWVKEVFKRDNYTCQFCGSRSGNGRAVTLNADHIKPWSLYPDARYDINNGRTLCVSCHKKTDSYAGKALRMVKKDFSHD